MSFEKPSVSGLMNQHHEISRFENLFFKKINTAYYNPKWGLDWDLFLSNRFDVSLGSFLSYVRQEAGKQGIVITEISAEIVNFTLELTVTIDGIQYTTNREIK